MSRYLVKFNELKAKNDYERELIDTINECITNIEEAKLNLDWQGPARDSFIAVYDEYIDNLKLMYNDLISCVDVQDKFYNNFSGGYREIKKGFSDLKENMVTKWKTKA